MKKGTTLKEEIKRVQGIPPKQYQQGWTEFYKLKFYLTPDVLIPRPETELLVDAVLRLQGSDPGCTRAQYTPLYYPKSPTLSTILDMGTGSGCIAISIAKNSPKSKILALDISPAALKVAEKNAKFHRVEDQIIFTESDLLSIFNVHPGGVHAIPDIIVANLPYIPTARLMLIDPMVADFEPKLALDGGRDGFELFRRMFKQMVEKSFFPKYLIAEIDETQGEVALAEVRQYFPNARAEIKKDLAKKDRILIIHFI